MSDFDEGHHTAQLSVKPCRWSQCPTDSWPESKELGKKWQSQIRTENGLSVLTFEVAGGCETWLDTD